MRRPTDSELLILRVLWDNGPCTVRDVHEALVDVQSTGYTTTLKLMQIMAEKGLVTRDDSARTHVYAARLPREAVQRQMVSDLMDRVFGGSASALVLQALNSKATSPEELREIRRLIDQFGQKKGAR